jgi:2-oxoglutarate dehydrogenase E2 component (dihydrolipoamide succinyltransferase)
LKRLIRALGAVIAKIFRLTSPTGQINRSSSMDIVVPEVGESIFEATVSKWHVADGASVNKDDLLCELETDKISLELNAESSGTIRLQAQEGETVKVGAVIATLSGAGEAAEPKEESKPKEESGPQAAETQSQTAPATKPVLESVKPAQPAPTPIKPPASAAPVPAAPAPKPVAAVIPIRDDQRTRRVAMSPIRKKIAAHLLYARQQTAMLTTFNEADLSLVQKLRAEHKEAFQAKHGVKLGLMSFFIRGCLEALKEYPEVNARIDGSDIVYQDFYDIGVAIGGEKGLVVPVIRDAEQLDYAGIEKAIQTYGEKVKSNKIELSDLEGGTFTISNGGVYGSMLSTPIINPPQCAVLGMHAIKQRAVVVDGEIVVRPMMYLALSYDHRLIDGKQAVGFLLKVKEFVENPDRKLLKL